MAKEIRLDIAGTTYREKDIVSLVTDRETFDGAPSIGNCICGELTAELNIPSSAVPRNAEFIPYVREEGGEWKKKSVFFVYNRDTDEAVDTLHITAYDAIYKAEKPFTQAGDQGYWPRRDIDVMNEIAQRTGTTICAATRAIMTKGHLLQYPGIILEDGSLEPVEDEGAVTMREMAASVAKLYVGNWIIDNNGEWRLIRLGDIPPETNYLITEDGEPIVLGQDRILIVDGLTEPTNMVLETGDRLLIGGVRLLV